MGQSSHEKVFLVTYPKGRLAKGHQRANRIDNAREKMNMLLMSCCFSSL